MSRPVRRPLLSVALPVYNGADTVAAVIESVLAQTCPDIELVISDNASTDATEEICRHYARSDERVVYLRRPSNIGLLKNFIGAAETTTGRYVRWLGDDDFLHPDYVARVLDVFDQDSGRVLVTTQIVYSTAAGIETLSTDYDPTPLAAADAIQRFAAMLQLLTSGFAVVDPLYSTMRRELAVMPRRNLLREDEVYAARLALAGPWGHVAAPLARRNWSMVHTSTLVRLLGVPGWHEHVVDVLEGIQLSDWIGQSDLTPSQRLRARVEVIEWYGRRKRNHALRGIAKFERMIRPTRLIRSAPQAPR